jgi:hypothetical protein
MSDRNIAGALFDFLGFLTTQEKSVSLGVSELATPAVDLLTEWAKTRGLGLDDADVSGWHSALQHAGQGEAWKHDCSALLTNDIELWINSCPHCGKPRPQPAVPEGWQRVMRGMVEYAECNDPNNPYLTQAQALLSAGKGE